MSNEVNIRLVINPITRTIAPKYRNQKAVYVAKGDHNSVLINFEMPRYVDGFDMSAIETSPAEENVIHIHYANTDGKNVSRGLSDAVNVEVEGDNIIFSWLVPNTATRYAGVVSIGITFEGYNTVDGKPQEVYSWSTAPYGNTKVWDSLDNTAEVTEREHNYLVETCNAIVAASLKKNLKPLFEEVARKATEKATEKAEGYRDEAKSYAVGKTGTRVNEDTDNALYYCEETSKYHNDVKGWHQDILTAKNAAVSAKDEAVSAKDEATSARDTATIAGDVAETAKNAAVSAKDDAVSAKDDAVSAKDEAVSAKEEAFQSARDSGASLQSAKIAAEQAKKYFDDTKDYIESSMRLKGEVGGVGAVRLDFVPEKLNNLTVNTSDGSDVKSYGKNLTDYRTPISGGDSHPLGVINVPMTVTVDIDKSIPFGSVQLAYDDGGQARITFATSNKVSRTSITIDGTNLKYGSYRVTTSNNTEVGAVAKIQLELGDKSTYYEAYKTPVNGIEVVSPTTTLVANDPTVEITATYNKDVGLVVQDLENKIATLETALANT